VTTTADIIAERDALRYLLDEITAVPPELSDKLPGMTLAQNRILGALLGKPGKVMTRAQLLAATMVCRPLADWPMSDVVDAHIWNIRKRLGPDSPVTIRTERGFGYSATWKEAAE
jgi:DNA-binding response OmpR family regulator